MNQKKISKDAWKEVFNYLDVREKTAASGVCKYWNLVIGGMLGMNWIDARIMEHREAINELIKLKKQRETEMYNSYEAYTLRKITPFIDAFNRQIKSGKYGKGFKKPKQLKANKVLGGISNFQMVRFERTMNYPPNIVITFNLDNPSFHIAGSYTMVRYETENGIVWEGWDNPNPAQYLKPLTLVSVTLPGCVQHILEVIVHNTFEEVAPKVFPSCFPNN